MSFDKIFHPTAGVYFHYLQKLGLKVCDCQVYLQVYLLFSLTISNVTLVHPDAPSIRKVLCGKKKKKKQREIHVSNAILSK